MTGLIVSLSVHAMHEQELQLVVNTPVAEAVRWLSSGTTESNVAAGVIAVCVAKSGFDIVSWPFRAFCNGRKEKSKIMKFNDLVARVSANETALNALREAPLQFVTLPEDIISGQFNDFGQQIHTVGERVAVLEQWKNVVSGKITDDENKSVDLEKQLKDCLLKVSLVEAQNADLKTQMVSVAKKAENAFHLGQKVKKLETDSFSHSNAITQLQVKVFPGNTDK